jgi:hypothetical protein
VSALHQPRLAAARLLHQVGGAAHALPLPGPAGLHEVGLWGQLPCWSTSLEVSALLPVARRLARQGELGLLIASCPATSRLLLCTTLPPVRVATLPPGETDSLALVRLARARPGTSRLSAAMACAAALDVDAAGRRAFKALRTGMDHASAYLPATLAPSTRHAWLLLQVTRLLFLRFVESEGWLDGRADFLAQEFDRCLTHRRHPEAHLFAPLFFGTLNRPRSDRSRRASAFGSVPFLNGGLFEPHPLERKRRWTLPVTAWHHLVALMIESFEVTLDHGDVGDRVSPELLGRVFEGMMDAEERKDGGTFYTPMELVPALLRATISAHLAPVLGRSETQIERSLDDRDPALDSALVSLRILDPAVGSGAFLVGALGLICDPAHRSTSRIRRVITSRLFGVDRNPAAVRLTELRLWLELLRTMRGRPAARLTPLPNLDTSIRAGDALHDPFAGLRLSEVLARRLAMARRQATSCHGSARRVAVADLHRIERKAARTALLHRIEILRDTIADLVDQGQSADLFGTRAPLHADTQHRVAALRLELRRVRRERARLRQDSVTPAFGLESAFAMVLARGGFDLVVGNPPWVRGERLLPRERAALTARYRWWRGSGPGWRHSPDLSVAFVERAHELLKPGGTLGFLVPGKLATTGYATRARAALADQTTLHVVADLGQDPRARFDAVTYPLALVTSKRRAPPEHLVALDLNRTTSCAQSAWRGEQTWRLGTLDMQRLVTHVADLATFSQSCTASLGVKTGANAAFLHPPAALEPWTRPAIRGRDIRSLSANATARILWPADPLGTPWSALPPELLAHLNAHRRVLERRRDMVRGPWWRLFRVTSATARWRVVWSDLAPTLRAAPLHDQAPVPLNSCYVAALPTEAAMLACAAWLNASAIGLLARSVAEPAANNFARFGARAVGTVPLPAAALQDPKLADLGRSAWSTDVALAIDEQVARWLRLGDNDREVIRALLAPGR